MTSERMLREELCRGAKQLYEGGHNAPADGNLSARVGMNALLTTPSGRHKATLRANEIVKIRLSDGGVIGGGCPSSELKMHLAIYRARPDVRAIVHAHSPNAVGLTVAGHSLEDPVVPEAIQTLGGIPTVPYASPTTQAVAQAVLPYALRFNAFILERHGSVTLGADLAEALSRLEVVEHVARITVAALAAGGASPIPHEEAARLRRMAVEAGVLRPDPASTPARGLSLQEEALVERLVERVLARLRA